MARHDGGDGARSRWPKTGLARIASIAVAVATPNAAAAGNGANYVLFNQYTAERGEIEFKLYNDVSSGGGGVTGYAAQLLEIEYGVSDYWTAALDLEGDEIRGENFAYGGFRFENRWRLFAYGTFLNPVLFAEYEQLQPEHRYLHGVTGRTDDEAEDEDEGATEHELETRLILGQGISKRLTVAFNWINETSFDTGRWEFGYAAGLTYALFKKGGRGEEPLTHASWDVEELLLGLELYGGLGDATLGLTLDPGKTQQYIGVNFLAELENNFLFGIGGAFGLTGQSEDALLRLQAGYKLE
jgi:hypothetical protein